MAEGLLHAWVPAFDPAGFGLCRGRSGSELCLVCACTLPSYAAALWAHSASFLRGKLDFHGCVGLEVGGLSGLAVFMEHQPCPSLT